MGKKRKNSRTNTRKIEGRLRYTKRTKKRRVTTLGTIDNNIYIFRILEICIDRTRDRQKKLG